MTLLHIAFTNQSALIVHKIDNKTLALQ